MYGKSTQDGVPTPDNPVEIVSVENPIVSICGKNLLTNAAFDSTYSGLTIKVNDDQSITVNGTATDVVYYAPFKFTFKAGVKYIVSGCPAGGSNETYFMYVNNLGGARDNGDGVLVHLDYDFNTDVGFCVRSGTKIDNLTFYPMVRIAGTQVGYEESDVKTVNVNHVLHGLPVNSGGNYTDSDGRQWICDEVDLERGVYVQRLELKTFTLYKSVYEFAPLGYRYQHHAGVNFTPENVCFCRTMPYNENAGTDVDTTDGVRLNRSAGYIIAQYTDIDGTADTIDLDILYVLATPIETPLTAEEITAFKALRTNYPNTTILNDAGAWMSVKYNADTKSYVDNRKTLKLVDSSTGVVYELKIMNGNLTVIPI